MTASSSDMQDLVYRTSGPNEIIKAHDFIIRHFISGLPDQFEKYKKEQEAGPAFETFTISLFALNMTVRRESQSALVKQLVDSAEASQKQMREFSQGIFSD